ncbi:MAG: 50S ribosomal protein L6 [Candidatus Omnitrophota bacterium]|nr:MAG: 50S ribosomal protein L6 [Candidatus Omnitrophota bacterium]
MSRVGKEPVEIPKEVKARLEKGFLIVESSKGKLNLVIPSQIKVEIENNTIVVKRKNESKFAKSLHGTIRALIHNMVKGAQEGFKKELDIIGVGYKAQMKGQVLSLSMGFSHLVEMPIAAGLHVSCPKPNRIVIEGIDKQQVGEFAAEIRKIYPPEPYKGKGIRYVGEEVRKKLGKALAK